MKYFHKFNKVLKEVYIYFYLKYYKKYFDNLKNINGNQHISSFDFIRKLVSPLLSFLIFVIYIPFIVFFSNTDYISFSKDSVFIIFLLTILLLIVYSIKFLKTNEILILMEKSRTDEEYRNYIKSRASIYLAISVLPALISIFFFVIYYREELFKQQ